MIQTVRASQFHRFLGTGRTKPAICGCEDEHGGPAGDFVVKLRGGIERGHTGLVAELVASRLAAYFGIPAPSPVLVSIDEAFANLVSENHSDNAPRMAGSVGLNFGSSLLNDVMTWPIDKPIPEAMWTTAVSIYAFDALIQNPDRKFSPNPNLFTRGDQIFVFDHELAFSFLEGIFPSKTPWKLDQSRYLRDHVFFRRLKGEEIDLVTFTAQLTALPTSVLPATLADIPPEWKNSSVSEISGHLCAVAEQAAQFAEQIRRSLA